MLSVRREIKILSGPVTYVLGCDEVGRGSLAGPVVAGVVAFDKAFFLHRPAWSKLVNDSKQLSARTRSELAFHIKHHALAWSIASVSPQVIDKINIHQANLLALYRAVEGAHKKLNTQLKVNVGVGASFSRPTLKSGHASAAPTYTLVDGRFTIPQWRGTQQAVVNGDAKVFSIAAASILAKVYRDHLMVEQDKKFPGYEFSKHKGYGTKLHLNYLAVLGQSPIHRRSFHVSI